MNSPASSVGFPAVVSSPSPDVFGSALPSGTQFEPTPRTHVCVCTNYMHILLSFPIKRLINYFLDEKQMSVTVLLFSASTPGVLMAAPRAGGLVGLPTLSSDSANR